jgi:hypothetical protein
MDFVHRPVFTVQNKTKQNAFFLGKDLSLSPNRRLKEAPNKLESTAKGIRTL